MAENKNMPSFNPFKLWGSWIGAIFGFVMALRLETGLLPSIEIGHQTISFGLFINIVGGFILGYGLHLMIRSLSKYDKA